MILKLLHYWGSRFQCDVNVLNAPFLFWIATMRLFCFELPFFCFEVIF